MVNLQGKESTALKTIQQSLENNLNIIASDSRLKTIVNKITDSRYTFKLLGETSTLPISLQRTSMLYKNCLYIVGTHTYGCALVIIDINTMKIVKQVSLSTVSNYVPLIILRDDTYYYIGFGGSGSHILKGLLETGEIVSTTIQGVVDRGMCLDENYLYTVTSSGIIRKIDKITLNILQTSSSIYNSPLDVKCAGDYIYITGIGTAPNTGAIAKVAKSNINTVVTTSSNLYNNENTWRLLIDGIYIYAASATGVIKKWLLSDLSYVSAFFTTGNNNPIYTIKKALNNIWVGDSKGSTYRVSETGSLLVRLQATTSANFALEIDENNQILYRNASDDATVAKHQIIDNLQNNASTTAIKTNDINALNTAGTWVNTVYTLNGMAMNCNTLNNGYLKQLSFTGTTTADTTFILATPNINNKLTPNKSYILNGVKSTDSLSTVFIRLTQYQNFDGSGLNKVTEKVAGDFKVFIAVDDSYLYYKIELVIKSGVTLTNSLYNNIPSMVPSSITYGKGEGPYLIKDLSTINLTSVSSIFNFEIVNGRIFCFATSTNPGIIEVRDYQSDVLLTTINTGGNQASSAFAYDDTYIYIGAIKGTTKSMYIQRYNRCTLAYVDEYLLYTNASPAFLSMKYKNGFVYAACAGTVDTPSHRIRKWDTTTLSTVSEAYFNTPTWITLTDSGLVVGGRNATTNNDDLQKLALLSYTDLSIIQLFPKTTLVQSNWRMSVNVDDNVFACNDVGILAKYSLLGNTLLAETFASFGTSQIRAIFNIKNTGIAIADSYGRIHTYDYNLNCIKYLEIFPVSNGNVHSLCVDLNNTIWYHSYQYPTIYKKQFIDLTKNIT